MSESSLAVNLQHIRTAIAEQVAAAGRPPGCVRLIAVSKTVDAEQVAAAHACGQIDFGENRAQELLAKAGVLGADYRWHFIGHLQQNKVRAIVAAAHLIHSVDSIQLAERIERIAAELGTPADYLVQVNISGEPSKFGVAATAVSPILAVAAAAKHSRCRGLMTMAPIDASASQLHHYFGQLRQLRDQLQSEFSLDLPELSMGMSGDFTVAIAEGATLVRIGTAVFGGR